MTFEAIGEELLSEIIDDRYKGVPNGTPPFALRDIGLHGWSIRDGDLPLPLLVARSSAIEHNIRRMQRYCDEHDVWLAPHGKTTMAPQIFQRQLAAGAWGMTAATVEQLAIYRHYGIDRVILANQVAGASNLRMLGHELQRSPNFELLLFVDSVSGVADLESTARRFDLSRPIDVLVEVGYAGGRTGVRDRDAIESILSTINASPGIRLRGFTAYEGLLPDLVGRHEDQIRALFNDVISLIDDLLATKRLPDTFIVSAGGSAAFDLVVEAFAGRWPEHAEVILRSGCYITHDHGIYAATSPLAHAPDPLRPALELWAYVQSRPEDGIAYATFGRRDAPYDTAFPSPIARIPRQGRRREPVSGIVVEGLNDQHARLRLPSDMNLAVGDTLIFGISHPCSAFDRWRLLMLTDDHDRIADGLLTFF